MDWLNTPVDVPISELIARKKRARMIEMLRAQLEGRLAPGVQVRLQLADLLVQAGRGEEAVPVLIGLADEFAADGFVAKAIAILKRVEKVHQGRTRRGLPPHRARAAAEARGATGPRRGRASRAGRARDRGVRRRAPAGSSSRRPTLPPARASAEAKSRHPMKSRRLRPIPSMPGRSRHAAPAPPTPASPSASAACSSGSSPRCRTRRRARRRRPTPLRRRSVPVPDGDRDTSPARSRRRPRSRHPRAPVRGHRPADPRSEAPPPPCARGVRHWRPAGRRGPRGGCAEPRDHSGAGSRAGPRGAVRAGVRSPSPRHRGRRAPPAAAARGVRRRAPARRRVRAPPARRRRCSPTSPRRSCSPWCAACACTPSRRAT